MGIQRSWQTDLADRAELARQANYAATEAAGQKPCLSCGNAAVVWLRCDERRFSAPLCDRCAGDRMLCYSMSRVAVTLDKIHGVSLVTTIDGIDLAQLAREILDCAVGDHTIASVQNVPGASAAADRAIAGKIRRPMVPSEQAALIEAVRTEFMARIRAKRAAQVETQLALATPSRIFA